MTIRNLFAKKYYFLLALEYAFMVNLHPFLSELSSVVELHLAKVDVEGSNPLARSIFQIS